MAGAAQDETPPIGMPGVHVHGGVHPPVGPPEPLPIFRKSFVLEDTPILAPKWRSAASDISS